MFRRAAFENGKAKELQILGNKNPVLIEINQKPYVPIVDVQGITRFLIDPESGKIFQKNDCDVFGFGLNEKIPYAYQGKRFCSKTGLIYFGKRYYDPKIRRWLTADPAGFVDSSNLYQFVYNNPYRFYDPNGESVAGYLLGLGEIVLGGAIIAGGVGLEFATFGGFTFGLGVTTSTGAALMGLGLATTTYHAQDIKVPNISWKNTDVYTPDRPLPNNPEGIHVPDVDAPHTQLGTKEGRHGKYPQAREFDEKGTPVRDIDFSDHGRPQNHPNPHQHEHKPNPTGGTRIRDPIGKPLTGWSYE